MYLDGKYLPFPVFAPMMSADPGEMPAQLVDWPARRLARARSCQFGRQAGRRCVMYSRSKLGSADGGSSSSAGALAGAQPHVSLHLTLT